VINVEVVLASLVTLVVVGAVYLMVRLARGNRVFSRYSSYASVCAAVRRDRRQAQRRAFAMTVQRSTPVAFLMRITRGGGAA